MFVYNVPIEPLDARYSTQWLRWFECAFKEAGVDYCTILGAGSSGHIADGSFLDVLDTNAYKATQLSSIIEVIRGHHARGSTMHDVVFFFHDLWFPGLEMLAYIRDGLGLRFKITGCLHAGTWDPFDFLTRKGMASWGFFIETGWLQFIDAVFLATHYHAQLLENERGGSKAYVTGFPIYAEELRAPRCRSGRAPLVVFPHRLDPEKNPQLFDELAANCSDVARFVKTVEFTSCKKAYYNVLRSSSIAVSFAQQETWGIAMQEALFCGCVPFVPARLSYEEMYPAVLQYSNKEELAEWIRLFAADHIYVDTWKRASQQAYSNLKTAGEQAIPNMLNIMEGLI